MIVAFTGHRPNKLGGYSVTNRIRARVIAATTTWLTEHRDDNELHCLTGMAQGFDQWAAYLCMVLGVPYTAVLPFSGQEALWPEPSRKWYRYLLEHASAIENLRPQGLEHCEAVYALNKRNEWMVDNCDLLLAAWDGTDGGTGNCVAYAEKVGRPVERLKW